MVRDVKVLVIGGGAAGLAAAAELERLNVPCQVLEAQSRLGGRVHTVPSGGDVPFERGAQMVNGDMTAVLALAAEAKLHVSPVPATGKDLCVVGGEVLSRDELVTSTEIEALLSDAIRSWSSPSEVVRSLWSLYRWWTSPWEDVGEAARGVASVTKRDRPVKGSVGAVIQRLLLCAEDEAITKTAIAEQFGADPDELNALALRNALENFASKRGDLEFQFPAGMSKVIETLSSKLSHVPILNSPVLRVSEEGETATVYAVGEEWRADRVIVTVPPPVARDIAFDIENESQLLDLLSAFGSGAVIKTTLRYPRPFWRDKGRSGAVTFGDPMGLEVCDTTYETTGHPQLTAFLGGPEARRRAQLDEEERQNMLLREIAEALGEGALHPVGVNEAVWVGDQWSSGGYNAFIKTHHPADAAWHLARWPGAVRFAGAELDDTFAGYVEGAIRSGRRVANEVALDLAAVPA